MRKRPWVRGGYAAAFGCSDSFVRINFFSLSTRPDGAAFPRSAESNKGRKSVNSGMVQKEIESPNVKAPLALRLSLQRTPRPHRIRTRVLIRPPGANGPRVRGNQTSQGDKCSSTKPESPKPVRFEGLRSGPATRALSLTPARGKSAHQKEKDFEDRGKSAFGKQKWSNRSDPGSMNDLRPRKPRVRTKKRSSPVE